MFAAIDQFAGHDMIVQDLRVRIDVTQKKIERGDALREPALDTVPLLRCDQARHQIVRKDAFGSLFAPINGEGDALGQKREFGGLLTSLQFIRRQAGQCLRQRLIVGAHIAIALPHFVEGAIQRVVSEKRFDSRWMAGAHRDNGLSFAANSEVSRRMDPAIPGYPAPRPLPSAYALFFCF